MKTLVYLLYTSLLFLQSLVLYPFATFIGSLFVSLAIISIDFFFNFYSVIVQWKGSNRKWTRINELIHSIVWFAYMKISKCKKICCHNQEGNKIILTHKFNLIFNITFLLSQCEGWRLTTSYLKHVNSLLSRAFLCHNGFNNKLVHIFAILV